MEEDKKWGFFFTCTVCPNFVLFHIPYGTKFPKLALFSFSCSFSLPGPGILKHPTGKSLRVLLNNVNAISIHPERWILWLSEAIFTCDVTLENKTQAPAAAESDSRQIFGGNSAGIEWKWIDEWINKWSIYCTCVELEEIFCRKMLFCRFPL